MRNSLMASGHRSSNIERGSATRHRSPSNYHGSHANRHFSDREAGLGSDAWCLIMNVQFSPGSNAANRQQSITCAMMFGQQVIIMIKIQIMIILMMNYICSHINNMNHHNIHDLDLDCCFDDHLNEIFFRNPPKWSFPPAPGIAVGQLWPINVIIDHLVSH
jgi:hypothetical protein